MIARVIADSYPGERSNAMVLSRVASASRRKRPAPLSRPMHEGGYLLSLQLRILSREIFPILSSHKEVLQNQNSIPLYCPELNRNGIIRRTYRANMSLLLMRHIRSLCTQRDPPGTPQSLPKQIYRVTILAQPRACLFFSESRSAYIKPSHSLKQIASSLLVMRRYIFPSLILPFA